ncbi:MAG: cytochrome c oxidase assembly protein [Microbacteriaceae bacterium]|nr:cytochrome c oxidase assembly protein [Microbacteriaceae bacterium]
MLITTWRVDGTALVALVIAGGLYAGGLVTLRRRGIRWPAWRTASFFLLGLGSFAFVQFGFLGVWSHDLRWAFSTRIALLLFAVPALLSVGQPVALARLALGGAQLRILDTALGSRVVRVVGNAVFAPIFALAAFTVFLTPIAGSLRESAAGTAILSIAVPVVGLLMVLPIVEQTDQRTSFFITIEFMLVFVELVLDAIPGILLRLNDHVLDGVGVVNATVPGWFPHILRDQQLSGDLLWFIAEVADIPILILLFVRWSRVDRREAKTLDDLSDDEMAALTAEHLRARRQ